MFKTAAKLTHKIYGTSRYTAVLEIGKNARAVNIIAASSGTITTTPPHGQCSPKNTKDHSVFSASCTPKNIKAVCFDFLYFAVHTRYRLMPISTYSSVHTGPKSQFGGLKNGFASSAYQVGIFAIVARLPIAPAKTGSSTDTNSFL